MLLVGFRVRMTVCTGHFGIVGRIAVTVGTLIPFSLVISAVNWKILGIMVEGSGCPGRFTVATGAIGRKLSRNMVRIGRIVVVIGVATRTGVGGIIVVAIMTSCTVIRNPCMRSVQRVVAVVIGEGRGLPGYVGMTGCTISGNIERYVVRIGCLVVIVGMTPCTGIRGIDIITVVTSRAVSSNPRMRTRERIVGVVIKRRGRPGCLRMARGAVGRELLHGMIGRLRLIVVV